MLYIYTVYISYYVHIIFNIEYIHMAGYVDDQPIISGGSQISGG